ncbi:MULTISPECIES: DUF892 family protein [Halorussus]|uniref:DUF892 family protein n=1 Tax=Halorussus TaxID=1070314 RepID=UPI00209EC956|nr:DUF892 family protein [Halorussus vallis]USZ74568.1 DUF892 family protein [Halorussus vallis]
MTVNNLEELFEHELEDIYYAEHEIVDALEDLENQVEHDDIKQAFRDHREQTQGHIERLEEVFDMLSEPPEEEECEAIQGIIAEQKEFAEQDPDQEVLDVFNVTAAQKVEHYEIAAYGNLAMLADRLGMDEAGDILHENLEEEEETLEKLKDLAESFNYQQIAAD